MVGSKKVILMVAALVALLALPVFATHDHGGKKDVGFERVETVAWTTFKTSTTSGSEWLNIYANAVSETKAGVSITSRVVSVTSGTYDPATNIQKSLNVVIYQVPEGAFTLFEEGNTFSIALDLDLREISGLFMYECENNICRNVTLESIADPVIRYQWELSSVSPTSGETRGTFRSVTGDRFTVSRNLLEGPAEKSGTVLGRSSQEFPSGDSWIMKSTTDGTIPAGVNYVPPPLSFGGVSIGGKG